MSSVSPALQADSLPAEPAKKLNNVIDKFINLLNINFYFMNFISKTLLATYYILENMLN